ncbi:MAG TPA: phosphoenolpyruvate carboxylase, partial [Candidatus Limnocylindria bacterium]|nr:phosphoenolpyruvate carboxylase [Candidatus Limnocylindria bacterium]
MRLLGDMLGRVIAESGGASLLRDVERLRGFAIRARDDGRYEREAERLVASWPLERAELVARAFTCYFHLANLAEEHHRARVIRERDRGAGALPESIAATVTSLRRGIGRKRLAALIESLEVHPVFTAHPTESRRRAVVTAIRRVGEQLERLEDARLGDSEREDARRRLAEEIDLLWRTAQVRAAQVTPLDEVRSFMAVFDETLFRMVPEVLRSLDVALGTTAPPFLRFGSWIGGDRDGNPAVTAEVTRETMAIQSEHALLALEAVANRVGRALTADSETTPASKALLKRLGRPASEPHRQLLLDVAARLGAREYRSAGDLLGDLRLLRDSLEAGGAARLARGEVQSLIWQAETFGFHLAELEVRQHARAHEQPSPEVLETMDAIGELQATYGEASCRRYVVSFTRAAADVAAVYRLARHAKRTPVLDVVPLFETLDDLRRAPSVMDEVLALPEVRRRMAANGRSVEVMLGYSDSAKEIGPLSATLALHDAQAALTAWARRNDVKLTLFHGRGGALGRGGGPANRAVRAQAPG